MAGPKLLDGVWETCSSPGTGNVSLLGAKAGYLSFSSGGATNNDTVFYVIRDQSGSNEEWGIGTWVTGPTLNRTAGNVLGGTGGAGSLVNFSSGTQDIFCGLMIGAFDKWLHTTDLYANLASLAKGRVLFPSDGISLLRDSGSALAPWGPIWPLTDPTGLSWSWVNQGGASVVTALGTIFVNGPANASTGLRLRVKTAPATPYHVIACLIGYGNNAGQSQFGLAFRESGSGKLLTCGAARTSGVSQFAAYYFSSPTTFNTSLLTDSNNGMAPQHPIWIRIGDNGTNLTLDLSPDGYNWIQQASVARTNNFTSAPDQVGIFVNPENSSDSTALTLLSWQETG